MSGTRATIEDVARRADVSVATVSRALRGMPNVAPETRSRVVEAAESLGYVPHAAAASLASGRSRAIGLVAPFFAIWYTSQVIAGVESVLSVFGYDLIVYAADTSENRAAFMERLGRRGARVDGLVLVDFFPDEDARQALATADLPIVSLGEHIEGVASLTVDNASAAHRAVRHLVDLGHVRIAIAGSKQVSPHGSPVLGERRRGYRRALREAGLEATGELELPGALFIAGGREAMDAIGEMDEPPTAVFCLSDEVALGLMGRASEIGVDVPGDLSVVGFDDHDLSPAFGLTTVRQPVSQLGGRIARYLLGNLGEAGIGHEPGIHGHVEVPVELIVRRSTSQPRQTR